MQLHGIFHQQSSQIGPGRGAVLACPHPWLSGFSPLQPVRRHRRSKASLLPSCSGIVIPAVSSFWSFLQRPHCSVRGTQQVGVTGWSAESPRRRRALDPVLPWGPELAGKCRAGGREGSLQREKLYLESRPPMHPSLWVADMARKLQPITSLGA